MKTEEWINTPLWSTNLGLSYFGYYILKVKYHCLYISILFFINIKDFFILKKQQLNMQISPQHFKENFEETQSKYDNVQEKLILKF